MRTVTVTEAKARLNELVDDAASTHEQIVLTRHGHPTVVILAADDLESLQETVHWMSEPGIRADIDEAGRASDAGDTVSSDELRAQLGIVHR